MKKLNSILKPVFGKVKKFLITIYDEYKIDSLYFKFALSFLAIIFIIIVLQVLYEVIIVFLKESGVGDLVSFIGNVVGALIGGGFTLIALLLTIRNERKKEDKTQRLNYKPYMSYEVLPLNINRELKNTFTVDLTKQNFNKFNYVTKKVNILIKNLGLNSALNFNIYRICYKDKISDYYSNQIIRVDDEILLSFEVNFGIDIINYKKQEYSSEIKFTVIYNDHLENYYEQDVKITIKYEAIKVNEYNERLKIQDIYLLDNINITERHNQAKYKKYKKVRSEIEKLKIDFE